MSSHSAWDAEHRARLIHGNGTKAPIRVWNTFHKLFQDYRNR
jgi:hypothetical protein